MLSNRPNIGKTRARVSAVVLDLDETLVHSCDKDVLDNGRVASHYFLGLYIFLRPHVEELLLFLKQRFGNRIYVWTAACPEYAEYVVDTMLRPLLAIPPERVFARKLMEESEAGFLSKRGEPMKGHKVLELLAMKLGIPAEQMFIVDNRSDVTEENGDFGVKVPYWYAWKPYADYDMALLVLIRLICARYATKRDEE